MHTISNHGVSQQEDVRKKLLQDLAFVLEGLGRVQEYGVHSGSHTVRK